jgi:hypothetical protein
MLPHASFPSNDLIPKSSTWGCRAGSKLTIQLAHMLTLPQPGSMNSASLQLDGVDIALTSAPTLRVPVGDADTGVVQSVIELRLPYVERAMLGRPLTLQIRFGGGEWSEPTVELQFAQYQPAHIGF